MKSELISLPGVNVARSRLEGFNSIPTAIQKITFVIPTYERVWEAVKAIAGVYELRIHPSQFEVSVVDNASTDELEEVCLYLESVLPNFSFRRWPNNLGAIENWRRGVDASSTDWVKMVFSDDRVTPGFLDSLSHEIDWKEVGGLVGGAFVLNGMGSTRKRYCNLRAPVWLAPQGVISSLLELPTGLPVSPSAGFGRRETYLKALSLPYRHELTDSAMGPDVVMNFLPLMEGQPLHYYPQPIAELVGGPTSITFQTNRYVRYGRYAEAILLMCDYTDLAIPTRERHELLQRIEFLNHPEIKSSTRAQVRKSPMGEALRKSQIITRGLFRKHRP